ncbi:MAG: AMP-binding protein [Betaproteobacteria bacterium]|nr:AMP-binding protein [Betaproteobacteria bacterium]
MPPEKGTGQRWDFNADTNLVQILATNAAGIPDQIALREKDRGIWQQTTWAEWLELVLSCAAGLEELGFTGKDGLLVLGDNRPNLYTGMLAAASLAGHAMPVYPDATGDEIRHVLTHADVRFVLAEDQEQADKILELRDATLPLERIIYDDPRGLGAYEDSGLVSWQKLIVQGTARLKNEPGLREQLIARAKPDDALVFIHSSGTTGRPKGVVLSHRNVLSGVANAYKAKAFGFGEEVLAYLPMAWVGDFATTVGAGIALQFTVIIPERPETVLHNLREIAPTFYLAAPRSWDNMLTMVQVRMEDSTWLKKTIYDFFMERAIANERLKLDGKSPTWVNRVLRVIGEQLVFAPIKDQFGLSRLRHAFTGGEAIGEDTFVFYRALGVKLRQLYGQTESSAFNAMQDVEEVRLHTVGRPLPGVETKINDDGEILIRSGSVFKGYYKQEDATAKALVDGWLHTGDAGYLEPDGHLVVLGRLSDVVHTAKGERYIPNYIENRLKFSPYIKDVAVLGAGRDTLGAIVCIDMEPVGHWAELRGISYMSYADLSQRIEVIELVALAVQKLNTTLPDALKIRHFVSLHKEFDADDGEITRTRKLRRNVVEERYAPIIDAIYAGEKCVTMKARVAYESGEVGVLERPLTIKEV